MRELVPLSDGEIEARFEEIGAGPSLTDIRFTLDALPDWLRSRQGWTERGQMRRSPPGTLVIEKARIAPDQPPASIYVVDFGTVRGVYTY